MLRTHFECLIHVVLFIYCTMPRGRVRKVHNNIFIFTSVAVKIKNETAWRKDDPIKEVSLKATEDL